MIRTYTYEDAAQRLSLDYAEFRFLAHHFWEFLPRARGEQAGRHFSGGDLGLFERIIEMQKEGIEISAIRQQLRQDIGTMQSPLRRSAEMLAFCSGRPGAGTSTVVWNLAAALAQRGCRCTVIDGSLSPSPNEAFEQSLTSTPWLHILDSGIRFLNATKVVASMEAADESQTREIVRDLQLLDTASDFILIDTGAGCSDNALRYAMLVDETVMITTADVGVNADTFSVVRMLRDIDPALPISLVINRAASLAEAREAFARINAAARKLNLSDVPGLGWIIEDEAIKRDTASLGPVVDVAPHAPAGKCFTLLAEILTNRLKPADEQKSGGLQDLIKSLEVTIQRNAAFRGL